MMVVVMIVMMMVVAMTVIMVMMMIVPVIMTVIMMMVVMIGLQAAQAGAERITQGAIGNVRAGCGRALALDVVMVAFLYGADLGFKAQNLRAVFAQNTGWRRHVTKGRVACALFSGERGALLGGDFGNGSVLDGEHLCAILAGAAIWWGDSIGLLANALGKGFEHFRVVAQVTCLDELHVGVFGGDLIGESVDAVDQDAGEQEVGEHDGAFVAEFCNVLEAWLDKREGHAGIADFAPTEAHAFLQHAGDLGDVAVGIGVGCAAPDDHEAGFVQADGAVLCVGAVNGLLNAGTGGCDHLGVDAEFAAIGDLQAVFGGVGVEHGGDVVFGVHRGKEHARNGEDALAARFAQAVETIADHWIGEFEIAVVDLPLVRQVGRELFSQNLEFIDGGLAA